MLDFAQYQALLLVFVRMTAFAVTAPFFAIRNVPPLAKAGLGAVLALLVFPVITPISWPPGLAAYVVLVLDEALLGLAMGFIATLVFSSIRIAGELVDLQMGFAMANIFDPQSNSRITLVGEFQYLLGIMLFLAMDGHHILIRALIKSYDLVPLGQVVFRGAVASQALSIFTGMFALAVRMALPIIAVLLVSDIALGMVARTVPQLNVFMLGFPLKAGLGLFALGVILPLLVTVMTNIFNQIGKDLLRFLGSFQ